MFQQKYVNFLMIFWKILSWKKKRDYIPKIVQKKSLKKKICEKGKK
jgi:hypothetical protein